MSKSISALPGAELTKPAYRLSNMHAKCRSDVFTRTGIPPISIERLRRSISVSDDKSWLEYYAQILAEIYKNGVAERCLAPPEPIFA